MQGTDLSETVFRFQLMFKSKYIYHSLSCQHYCSCFSLKLQKSESALLGDISRKSPSHSETLLLLFPLIDCDSEK